MKEIPDKTGRFRTRPYYTIDELDRECEEVLAKFAHTRTTPSTFPLATGDLESLIEDYAEDLDSFADLTKYGNEVEGVTIFRGERKPLVRIASSLHEDSRRENRYRTTLTHEFGHLHFHRYLFDFQSTSLGLPTQKKEDPIICKRDNILAAPEIDWLEWQAGYVSTALLIPITPLKRIVTDYRVTRQVFSDILLSSAEAEELIETVTSHFRVSVEAAKIRLLKRSFITQKTSTPSLF